MTRPTGNPERVHKLATDLLESNPARFGALDAAGEVVAFRVAYSIVEIEEACSEYLAKVERMPDPAKNLPVREDDIDDLREALRHLIYHVGDSIVFASLLPSPPP